MKKISIRHMGVLLLCIVLVITAFPSGVLADYEDGQDCSECIKVRLNMPKE